MPSYRPFKYRSHDGLTLHARVYEASPDYPAVICMPGLTRNSADFHKLAEHLTAQSKVKVYSLDFRGRGSSDWDSNPSNYNPLRYAEDLQAFVQNQKLENIILIGTSLGGLVAMIYTAHFDNTVAGIVLNDIGPEIDPTGLARIQSYVGKTGSAESWNDAKQMVKAINEETLPDLAEAEWTQMTEALMHEAEDGRIVFSYDPAISEESNPSAKGTDFWSEFDALRQLPVLVIRGVKSDILNSKCVETMLTSHDKLAYCEVSNRGHAPLLNEPEALAAIEAYLAKHFKI